MVEETVNFQVFEVEAVEVELCMVLVVQVKNAVLFEDVDEEGRGPGGEPDAGDAA